MKNQTRDLTIPARLLHRGLGGIFLLSLLILASAAAAETNPSWDQFRGPHRDGKSLEQGLLRSWPEEGPARLWQRPIGEGFSGVSVAKDHLYTLFAADQEEFLGCFKTTDGEEVWRLKLGETFLEMFGNGPRSTPTLEDGKIYALGSRGLLVAASAVTGDLLWQVDLATDYSIVKSQTLTPLGATPPGPQLPVYGYASSPLIIGDLLIVETGAGEGRSLVAFNKADGKQVWSALDTEIGYSSPTVMTIAGEQQIVLLPGQEIIGLSLEGEVRWRFDWAPTPSQPLFVAPDKILVSTVNDVGAMLIQVSPGENATKNLQVESLWRTRRLKNAWNSSIIHEGHVYGFDNATLRCVDLASGELRWAQRGLGQGNLIFADGMVLVLSDKGKLVLAEVSPEGFVEKGSTEVLEGRSWTAPTLANGILYLRNHEQMLALDVQNPKG